MNKLISQFHSLWVITFLLLSCTNLETPGNQISETKTKNDDPAAFLEDIRHAFAKKDPQLLAPLLADSIDVGSDGSFMVDKATFLEQFSSSDMHEWRNYKSALRLGYCIERNKTDERDSYYAPCLPSSNSKTKEVYIIGTKVNVRSNPSKNATVLGQLSETWVPLSVEKFDALVGDTGDSSELDWIPIWYKKGKVGYVATEFTHYGMDNGRFEAMPDKNGNLKIVYMTAEMTCGL